MQSVVKYYYDSITDVQDRYCYRFVVLVTVLSVGDFSPTERCATLLWEYCVCYSAILLASMVLDVVLSVAAMRGGILDTEPRRHVKYIIYIRLCVMLVETAWLSFAVFWLVVNYKTCPVEGVKEAILGMVICNWVVVLTVMFTVWCVFDAAGRSWVKMKKYQRSMRESESRFQYKRSGNRARNWRQRKVLRAYQDSWDHRCRLLFCCIRNSDRSKNSFTDIARLLSDFFRDLDVVPSDVVAGLVLLRKFQKIEREANVNQRKNDTYEYLSGVPVTPRTKFLPLGDVQHYQHFQAVIHFMRFALAAYGWPIFIMTEPVTSVCKLCPNFSCLLCRSNPNVNGDNCCGCNYAALKGMLSKGQASIVYATYHVDVAETPFFVAVDFTRSKVVVSIRGTLSMKDVITDLNAESETLPLNPPKEDWLGHKGMVHAAVYIRDKLEEENILGEAFQLAAKQKPDEQFGLVLVGHSLGAGTASILAILLRQTYPDLQCFAYSPPGGLLSMPAVQYTKSFITSVVLGKDVVPRIGLHQMESLRADLINAIKRSRDPKWKTITCSVLCCGCAPMPTSAVELKADCATMQAYQMEKKSARAAASAVHPHDNTISLTLHQPLYPPGSIIHVVRHHPSKTEQKYEKKWRQVLKKHDPVYQAIWANNTDFDEVLISPVMIQDHMPDKVLEALNKVITSLGPAKPQRMINNNNNSSAAPSEMEHCKLLAGSSTSTTPPPAPHRLCLETSFTSHSIADSNGAATANSAVNDSNHLPWEFVSLVPSPPSQERRSDENGSSDQIHDDWFGLAPLATPESFSEVSSISSRASSMIFGHSKTPDSGRLRRKAKKSGHANIKESLSVRFDETLNDITDISLPSEEYCSESNPKNNLLSRIFRRKRTKEDEKSLTENEPLPTDTSDIVDQKLESQTLTEPNSPPKVDDSLTSNESSPLLSSLHLLTDQRLAEILGRPLVTGNPEDLNNDSVSSTSFHSGEDSTHDVPGTISSDSVTVNAEIHRSPEEMLSGLRSESSLGGDSLLEDIERSLNISLSRTGSSARLTSLSRTGSGARLTEVEIDISDPNDMGDLVNPAGTLTTNSNKYMYPILHVSHGESSV
ncbi:inactivation no afterpotential E isoform X3 [Rhodnius prolixus]|uniref:inactivation no afterpotential E isoform X3 n=1 Tax=Rhodnius prolixus TaxID=13249 RepID=UPI003D188710